MASSGLFQTLLKDFSDKRLAARVNCLSVDFVRRNSTKSSTSLMRSTGRASIFLIRVATAFGVIRALYRNKWGIFKGGFKGFY